MNKALKALATNVRYYRILKNYTQEKLAEKSDSSSKYIADIENRRYIPSLKKMCKIAKALGKEPFELLIYDSTRENISHRSDLYNK